MKPYALVWHEEAVLALAALPKRAQRRLCAELESVKSQPTRRGDFQEKDAAGRSNEVLLTDDWLVTFWADHAVQEIRVVRLEKVED